MREKYICDMLCFALAYLRWFDARTPCNILISPCLEGITCDGPHLSERFTPSPCNLCGFVLFSEGKFDTHTIQIEQQHKGGSFITGNKNLLNGPTPHLLQPPALHIITLAVRCSQESTWAQLTNP